MCRAVGVSPFSHGTVDSDTSLTSFRLNALLICSCSTSSAASAAMFGPSDFSTKDEVTLWAGALPSLTPSKP